MIIKHTINVPRKDNEELPYDVDLIYHKDTGTVDIYFYWEQTQKVKDTRVFEWKGNKQ